MTLFVWLSHSRLYFHSTCFYFETFSFFFQLHHFVVVVVVVVSSPKFITSNCSYLVFIVIVFLVVTWSFLFLLYHTIFLFKNIFQIFVNIVCWRFVEYFRIRFWFYSPPLTHKLLIQLNRNDCCYCYKLNQNQIQINMIFFKLILCMRSMNQKKPKVTKKQLNIKDI